MPLKRTLFQITEDMKALDELLDEAGGDVTDEEEIIDAWIEENREQLQDKIDGYAYYCEELNARSEAIWQKIKELKELRKVLANRAKSLKDHLQYMMEHEGIDQIKGKTREVRLQGNGGKYPVEIYMLAEELPEPMRQIKFSAVYDAIIEAAGDQPGEVRDEDGHLIAIVHERGQHITFK